MTETKTFVCSVCAATTTLPVGAATEKAAAAMGWGVLLAGSRPLCCSAGCRQQAARDAQNGVISMDGHEVERRLAAERAATPRRTTADLVDRERKDREVISYVRCVRRGCGAVSELVGMLDSDGVIAPDPTALAATLGFELTSKGWACGKYCRDVMALEAARAGKPVKPVLVLNDATVAARLQKAT